ncbi:hypothetical protein BUALT_Bualt03G0096700 [Buddleja alternifolia]|uniref:Peptidase A1 domain-containing protein n=1 Tax=Buddleja alternifolia TaxID=168488 RepID=A0AAV6XUK6_9LAMI|nr:hypothetical protein BUALT_Bualt03G0096700 [Buddleja alternifolia]
MELLFSLFLALLFASTSSIRVNQEVDQFKHPALHLPLYHTQDSHSLQSSAKPLPFSQALALDDARVKFLNSRISKKNSTSSPRSSQLINEKSTNLPLNPGQSLGVGNYYTRIGLGTPPTYHLVVVDTGSSFSWIQCEPCTIYCHPQVGSHFNPSSSNTYQRLSCDTSQCSSLKDATLNSPKCSSSNACIYAAAYGDQSFSVGYLSKESLTLSSESIPGFVFGWLFGKSAGLVGLARNQLSMLSQLSVKYGKAFSYCLPTAMPLGKIGSGGYLSFGITGSNPGYKFTPMLSDSRDPSLYFIKISAISVSGKALSLPPSDYNVPTIIDSGTVISRLAGPVYSSLREEVVKIVSAKYQMAEAFAIFDACFKGSYDEISAVLPSVKLLLQGGAELSLAPHNVIMEVEKGTTCLAFAGNSNLRDIAIIGNQQHQGFDVVYDIAGSRIGFASGGCS